MTRIAALLVLLEEREKLRASLAMLARAQRDSPILLVGTEDKTSWVPTQDWIDEQAMKFHAIEEPLPTKQRKSKGERKRDRWRLK